MFATVVIPTISRPDDLARTLALLAGCDSADHACEVVIVDNASEPPVAAPEALSNGWEVRTLVLPHNAGAAGRNIAAAQAMGEWLLMLDDDSAPMDTGWIDAAMSAHADTLAIGAEVLLPSGRHEAGGLPEVVVGCGALLRRDAFLDCGGYDASFEYYGEETDLCARFIEDGGRITYDPRFRVLHRRSDSGRNLSRIMERLARNEALTIWRYAPDRELEAWLDHTLARRRVVAAREGVSAAFKRGADAFRSASMNEPRRPLAQDQWDRLTGTSCVRGWIRHSESALCAVRMPSGAPGKHTEVITSALALEGVLTEDAEPAAMIIAGTLAPGLALDAAQSLAHEYHEKPIVAITPLLEAAPRGTT